MVILYLVVNQTVLALQHLKMIQHVKLFDTLEIQQHVILLMMKTRALFFQVHHSK